MIIRLSEFFFRTLREDPVDAEVTSHKLLVRAGYIRRAAPGIYTWLPLGLRVLARIEEVVRQEQAAAGAQEVHFPALLPREPYEATGRWTEYGPNLFKLQDRRGNDYLLAPTHEEMFTLLVKDHYSSYKELPVTLYQIQTKYRDEARPRAGLIRGREFIMKDAYSFDLDDDGLAASYQAQRDAYQRIFNRLGLEYVIVQADSGAMGGSASEEFLNPSPIGEDTFVRSAGGYAANVEAVTTTVPSALPTAELPAARRVATPESQTIEKVIAHLNAHEPRVDRPWSAADTLKHVVVALRLPDGARELLVVGIPGDRDIDDKRLAAAVAPAEVDGATEADFAAFPQLVRGYIGPQDPVAHPEDATTAAVSATNPDGTPVVAGATALRYALDPRVVTGTSWVTGANRSDEHFLNLVAGRDFPASDSGTVEVLEAAQVLEGDPAPDGSGPLTLARGIEIGHIFALGRKYAEALDLKVLDQNGKSQVVTMGSYGIGVTRVLAALAEANNDDRGLVWPVTVAPAQVHIVATGKEESIFEYAGQLAGELSEDGIEVIVDDRPKLSAGVKFADAELIGVPVTVVVGRGFASGEIEVRPRDTTKGAAQTVSLDQAVPVITELLNSLHQQA